MVTELGMVFVRMEHRWIRFKTERTVSYVWILRLSSTRCHDNDWTVRMKLLFIFDFGNNSESHYERACRKNACGFTNTITLLFLQRIELLLRSVRVTFLHP